MTGTARGGTARDAARGCLDRVGGVRHFVAFPPKSIRMTVTSRSASLVLLGAALLALPSARADPASSGAARCVVAARVFLEGLVPEQRKRVVRPFDHAARRKPAHPPGAVPATTGIRTGELADGQRVRLHDFLGCGLSSQGYQKVIAVVRRAEVVRQAFAKVPVAERETRSETGPGFFWITVFGEPSAEKPFGWRIEGHHLSIDFTVANGRLAVSPAFLGAEPAVMTRGAWAGFRVLDAEFARGLELLESLTPPQRQRAVLGATLPAALLAVPGGPGLPATPAGLPAAALDEAQRTLLWRLVDEYVGNLEPGTAAQLRARIAADGVEKLHFAWMGPVARGQPVYYRLQGPSLQVEFLHAPNAVAAAQGPDLNHIHVFWRVPGGDFGDGLAAAAPGGP